MYIIYTKYNVKIIGTFSVCGWEIGGGSNNIVKFPYIRDDTPPVKLVFGIKSQDQ
jgi:hypothetical protein